MDNIPPTIPEIASAISSQSTDRRLYGDFSAEPATSVPPAPATTASQEPSSQEKTPLDLTYNGGSAGQKHPSFGQRGAHGHLTEAFTPTTNTPKITINAQSPGTLRYPNPNELGNNSLDTIRVTSRPTSPGNRSSFSEELSNRSNAATTDRLPPLPQDAIAALNPAPHQRASTARLVRAMAASAAGAIGLHVPGQHGTLSTQFSISASQTDRPESVKPSRKWKIEIKPKGISFGYEQTFR